VPQLALADGNVDAALAALLEALILAEPGGYIQVFIDHGETPCREHL